MEKQVALVTGASSGMGMKIALELLGLGFRVYGCARRVENMKQIESNGGKVLALDLTNEEFMVSCVDEIVKREGRIDVLINNAGYGCCGSIEDVPIAEVRNQYEVNVFGFGRMIQLVLPHMRKHNYGKIINISSMGGRLTTPFGGWYHSTKYAVESISDSLRMETRGDHIDVIVIEPGLIQTNWGVIAAENIRTFSGKGHYKKYADRAARYYEKRYGRKNAGLSDPQVIANTVRKALLAKHPKTRYLVGKNAKMFVLIKQMLSDKLFQSVARVFMGLNIH